MEVVSIGMLGHPKAKQDITDVCDRPSEAAREDHGERRMRIRITTGEIELKPICTSPWTWSQYGDLTEQADDAYSCAYLLCDPCLGPLTFTVRNSQDEQAVQKTPGRGLGQMPS